MTWAEAVKDMFESLVTLGVILAIFTNFWSNIARRGSRREDDED